MCNTTTQQSKFTVSQGWRTLFWGIFIGVILTVSIGRSPLLLEANWSNNESRFMIDSRIRSDVCIAEVTEG